MLLSDLKSQIPSHLLDILKRDITNLRPAQSKAVKAGLLNGNNLLICTPTASGKTLIAELAIIKNILETGGKAIYIVPLKALASEKFKDFKNRYAKLIRIALSIGNLDSKDPYLDDYDLIICTAEKLDSLIRHHTPWLTDINTVVIDEIHLLNDVHRGPTLEILITILRQVLKKIQIIALSATIGNPQELSGWLSASLVLDKWRPVQLKQGVYFQGEIEFKKEGIVNLSE
ncbi:MAG: DEAD/DEAH box helicase [Nanoarchaeota archaeon]